MTSPHDLAADLAARFRLDKRPRSWGGDCPVCSYARAFSVWVGKGPRPSLYCANGCSREAQYEAAQSAIGGGSKPQPRPADADEGQAREAKQARAAALWAGSTPCPGTPAGLYLARRVLPGLASCGELRHRGDCPHPEQGAPPALVARVTAMDGGMVAIHRTYLTPERRKAMLDPPRASLGPIWGGAVRLEPAAAELVIGEGIETAASAGLLLGLPAWAALSAGNLARGLQLPPEVRAVVIAVDPDPPGERAAANAAARWQAEGRNVRLARPDRPGQDFNDLLQARARAAEAAHG